VVFGVSKDLKKRLEALRYSDYDIDEGEEAVVRRMKSKSAASHCKCISDRHISSLNQCSEAHD
jgi:hypothetical protein